jgi:hypothetical protein
MVLEVEINFAREKVSALLRGPAACSPIVSQSQASRHQKSPEEAVAVLTHRATKAGQSH